MKSSHRPCVYHLSQQEHYPISSLPQLTDHWAVIEIFS
uniref:Uncharacterized protein n=1 Tax=Rhizophora mucronata TaxID=61149 RepID=A0A2P2P1F6_RHIMU